MSRARDDDDDDYGRAPTVTLFPRFLARVARRHPRPSAFSARPHRCHNTTAVRRWVWREDARWRRARPRPHREHHGARPPAHLVDVVDRAERVVEREIEARLHAAASFPGRTPAPPTSRCNDDKSTDNQSEARRVKHAAALRLDVVQQPRSRSTVSPARRGGSRRRTRAWRRANAPSCELLRA